MTGPRITVWVVSTHACCDHDDIDSVWGSEEAARQRAADMARHRVIVRGEPGGVRSVDDIDVEPWALNEVPAIPGADPFRR